MKSNKIRNTRGIVGSIFLILSLVVFATFASPSVVKAIQGRTIVITENDTDGDGVPNDQDSCPDSNLLPTVIVKGCDAGVPNDLFPDGCTMSDLIQNCYDNSKNHGDFVSCAGHLIDDWYNIKLMTGAQRRDIKQCIMSSDLQSTEAYIAGTVFNDANGNGQQDDDESEIAGVTVTLDGTTTAVTGAHGQYQFLITKVGTHTVVETDPFGFISTTSNKISMYVVLGQYYIANFGDAAELPDRATIYGTVFNDTNGNGLQDDEEVGVPWVTVALDGNPQITNGLGEYTFQVFTAGSHTIVETDPPGYRSTTPNAVNINVELDNSYLVNFGDTDNLTDRANIYGTVFNDDNGNGLQDPGETGIPGVSVTLDDNTVYVANYLGQYTFQIAEAGTHKVTETDPDGFISTTPNEVTVDVVLGNSYLVDFGDAIEIIPTTTTVEPTTTTTVIPTTTTTTVKPTTTTTIIVPPPDCITDADCDDGNFCNGAETCVEGVCQSGQNPCDLEQQVCSESLKTCVDIKKIEASTAFLPRRDERKLRAPLLLPKLFYWLRVKIKAENNVDLSSKFAVEGPTQGVTGVTGVTIDNTRFRKIREAFLRKNRENVFWVPIGVAKNATPGTYKITITTDRTDAADPFIEIVEGRFIIREKLFQR